MREFLLRYICCPLKYSVSGIRYALSDRAFRLEAILGVVCFPWIYIHFSTDYLLTALIFMAYMQILVIELINCAIEKAVDFVSPEYHILAKKIKDISSAAVFLSVCSFFILLIYTWTMCIW